MGKPHAPFQGRDGLVDLISRSRMAIFVGRNDTGKSTLIRRIAAAIDASIVDADIGQSDIGPPAVVSLGERRGGHYEPVDGYFCGSTTPAKHFLPLIAGTLRMAGRARRYPVLVNTTGLATGPVGRMLKTEKINALSPDVIVGIGEGLEYLDAFDRAGPTVVHLPVSPAARQKSRTERTDLRKRSFAGHFREAVSSVYPFGRFAVERSLLFNGRHPKIDGHILRIDVSDKEAMVVAPWKLSDPDRMMARLNVDMLHVYTPGDFTNALVGLVDARGRFSGLGIIESMDFERKEMRLYTPARDFSVLQMGSIKLDIDSFDYIGPFSALPYRRKHK